MVLIPIIGLVLLSMGAGAAALVRLLRSERIDSEAVGDAGFLMFWGILALAIALFVATASKGATG